MNDEVTTDTAIDTATGPTAGTSGPTSESESGRDWTREAEWLTAERHEHSQQQTSWCRLVNETSATPVVVTRFGNIFLVDQFARDLVTSGIHYAEVIEPAQNPPAELEWDYLTDIQFAYHHYLVEMYRLADDSLPGLIVALVETVGAMGAEWLQRDFGPWCRLVDAWPNRQVASPATPAVQASITLFATIAARWGLAGNPTPAQAAAIDVKTTVADTIENFDRPDLIELARILITAAEEVGLAALNTGTRPSLGSTRLPPETALAASNNDGPPF